jgi:hypothetical protein
MRIAPLLVRRPDLSWVLASYLRRFERRTDAADVLLAALKQDPTYDAAAANYIDAMDRCEPTSSTATYRRAIQTVGRRSEENSIVLRVASSAFRGKRRPPLDAARLIEREPDRRAKGLLLHRLFGDAPDLDEFATLYNPANRHQRQATWSAETPEGRWRVYEYDELVARDKASLDIFWLKDESLADSDNLPPPEVIAQEIVEDLEAALEQFRLIAADLGEAAR